MKIKGYTFEVTILNKRKLNEILFFTKRKLSSADSLISKTEVVLKNSLELEDQLVFIKYNNSGIEVYRNSFIIPKIEIGTISIRYEIEEQKESYYLRYTKQNQNDSTINDSTTKRYYSFEYEDFNELELIPPVGIPVTNLRIWKSPLKEIELERHSRDIFNWGTEFPNDESYISKEIQTNSDPEFVKDFFSEEFEFPENSRTYQINSRKNKILEFALESFMLRNQTTKWVDIVKNQEIDIDLNKTDEDFIVLFVIAKKDQDLPSNLSINNNDPIHSSESLRFSDFENLDDNFNIYPNPTNSNIYISKPTSVESFTCIIKTFDGKQIIDKVYDKDAEIELQNFENGIYYITIYIDGQVFETKKIIKL